MRTKRASIKKILLRIFALVVETVLLLFIGLYGILFIVAKGPSPTATTLFVKTVRETSAMKFLANLYLSDEEIEQIEKVNLAEYQQTDASLINMGQVNGNVDAFGKVDEDGDGIILEEVKGAGYQGYMMIVLDPSRVIMGTHPESYGVNGYTVEEMVQSYNAVAGVNAGGFYDPNGTGNGSIPDSLVVYEGVMYYPELGIREGFVGLDDNHIMYTGPMSIEDIQAANIQYGVCFGPALIMNGVPVDPSTLTSGINPRTAIGQRSDGAILLLVIDGRQASSLGATYQDLSDVMFEYGAVTACNLDGGSSSMMYYNGAYVNNSASVIGIRPVPDTFIVLAKEGE